jgi:hypothetical protein
MTPLSRTATTTVFALPHQAERSEYRHHHKHQQNLLNVQINNIGGEEGVEATVIEITMAQ